MIHFSYFLFITISLMTSVLKLALDLLLMLSSNFLSVTSCNFITKEIYPARLIMFVVTPVVQE